MHPLNTNEEIKMKQIEYFGKIYDVKEDAVVIGINSFYQVFTKNNKCEYTFIELRNDLIGKFNVLPQTMAIASEEPKPHPHADLMLKYAMIAQYDDKPWECFEFKNQYTDGWSRMADNPCFSTENEYRLKPQEPKIQLGQIWVSKEEGVSVVIDPPSSSEIIHFSFTVGGLKFIERLPVSGFLLLFKLKENK